MKRRTRSVSRRTATLIAIFVVGVTTAAGLVYARVDGQPVDPAGTFSLPSYAGHPVLLSFLDTQATAAKTGDPSRAQVVFLKSMERQNEAYGLRVVIIDAADVVGKPEPSREMLTNYGFDEALPSSIRVFGDRGGAVARAYGVTTVPMTFLIDQRGVIRQHWDRFASAAELDFAIGPLVGRSVLEPPTGG
jgi:peroxiredoxin